MKRPLLPSEIQHLIREDARRCAGVLQAVSGRLGTAAERPGDYELAQRTAAKLRRLQMAIAGLAELHRVRRRRGPLAVSDPQPCAVIELPSQVA